MRWLFNRQTLTEKPDITVTIPPSNMTWNKYLCPKPVMFDVMLVMITCTLITWAHVTISGGNADTKVVNSTYSVVRWPGFTGIISGTAVRSAVSDVFGGQVSTVLCLWLGSVGRSSCFRQLLPAVEGYTGAGTPLPTCLPHQASFSRLLQPVHEYTRRLLALTASAATATRTRAGL